MIKSDENYRQISFDKSNASFAKLSTASTAGYAKYLSVTFDSRVSFKIRTNNFVKELPRSIGIMAKMKLFFDIKIMQHLHYAVSHPHVLHGFLIWSSTYKTYLKILSILCKIIQRKLMVDEDRTIEQRFSIQNFGF